MAYQEFTGFWSVRLEGDGLNDVNLDYKLDNVDKLKNFALRNKKESVEKYCQRYGFELYQQYRRNGFTYATANDEGIDILLWSDRLEDNRWLCGYSKFGYDSIIQM